MKKKKNKVVFNIIQLLLPGLLILINWLILDNITDNTLQLLLMIEMVIIVFLSIYYNDNEFKYTFIALIIYSLINTVPITSCSSGGSSMFPCMHESIVGGINLLFIILYFIICGIRCIMK